MSLRDWSTRKFVAVILGLAVGGVTVSLAFWLTVVSLWNDHVLLHSLVAAINQAQQQQAHSAPPPPAAH